MPPSPIYHTKQIVELSFRLLGICLIPSGYHIFLSFSKPTSVIVLNVYLSYVFPVLLSKYELYLIPSLYKISTNGFYTKSTC